MWFNTTFFIPPTSTTTTGEILQFKGKAFTFSGEDTSAKNR